MSGDYDALSDFDHDASTDEEDGNGFVWSGDHWQAASDCSQSPIPLVEEELTRRWRLNRHRGTEIVCFVQRIGTPCLPSALCPECKHEQSTGITGCEEGGFINIHTVHGTIRRQLVTVRCPMCGAIKEWNPASEMIHTVANRTHGGDVM